MRLLVSLALAACVGCAHAKAPAKPDTPKADTPIVVADGRDAGVHVDHSAWEHHAAVQAAREAAVAHWLAQDATLEETFQVLDVAEGAFTRPDTRQQAVLYLVSAFPRADPKNGIAIVEDGALVHNIALAGGHTLYTVSDLDGDGRHELALIHSFMMGGSSESGLVLFSLSEFGDVREWGRATLAQDDCGMLGIADVSGASAVRVVAEAGPTFFLEPYEDPACSGKWLRVGDPQPVELYPPLDDSGYAILPVD